MPPSDQQEIEVGDVEGYRSDKLHQFNHQALVMEILRRCAENGSHEMRPGWFNEKRDRTGNVIKVYIEDTQQKFSETVATAVAIMACDFDEESSKNIDILEKELKAITKSLLESQWNWWVKKPPIHKSKLEEQGKGIAKEMFNFNLGWYKTLVQEKVRIYRAIFRELNLLTKRIDFYTEEDFVA